MSPVLLPFVRARLDCVVVLGVFFFFVLVVRIRFGRPVARSAWVRDISVQEASVESSCD